MPPGARDKGCLPTVNFDMVVSSREIDAWARWMRAAGRPESTIGLRTYHVRRVMAEIKTSPWRLTTDELVDYLAASGWAPETRRAYRASLRNFYKWAQASGRREDSPADLIPPIRLPRSVPRPTPERYFEEALANADDREQLMLLLAGTCGLRRGEIARVRREDLERDLEGWSLRVKGKGGHVRMVPLDDALARRILAHPAGWLFPSPQRSGPLTAHHVGVLVSRLLPEGWTCHTLRHRCATKAYAGKHDLRAVQELLGHAKPETTARYTQVPQSSVREAMRAAAV
jgi:integrase/recombinase XerC